MPKILNLLNREPPLKERPRVDSRGCVSLEIDQVAFMVIAIAAEEVVESHLVERRGRGIRCNVAANPLFRAIRFDHHCHRVPANNAADAVFQIEIPRIRGLFRCRNRVDIGCIRSKREGNPLSMGKTGKLLKKITNAL